MPSRWRRRAILNKPDEFGPEFHLGVEVEHPEQRGNSLLEVQYMIMEAQKISEHSEYYLTPLRNIQSQNRLALLVRRGKSSGASRRSTQLRGENCA